MKILFNQPFFRRSARVFALPQNGTTEARSWQIGKIGSQIGEKLQRVKAVELSSFDSLAERLSGMQLQELRIVSHGEPGTVIFPNNSRHQIADPKTIELFKQLIDNGSLIPNGLVVFAGCTIGRSEAALKEFANKTGLRSCLRKKERAEIK
jgi:hypothetical protein